MTLVTVGTGTVSPSASRCSAAHWVETDGRTTIRLLFDCGPGTLHGLARHALPWIELTHIAITHFHPDHFADLPPIIFAMKYGAMQPRTAPLTIIGPVGMCAKLDALASAFGDWVSAPGFPLEVREIAPGGNLALGELRLTAHKTPHTDESIAYSLESAGRRLVYTGDTGPSDDLGDWSKGCDLLLAECSLPESMAMGIHLTPRGAGLLAARAQAKRLVLTHLYPPVEAVDISAIVATEFEGPVTVAKDGDRFVID